MSFAHRRCLGEAFIFLIKIFFSHCSLRDSSFGARNSDGLRSLVAALVDRVARLASRREAVCASVFFLAFMTETATERGRLPTTTPQRKVLRCYVREKRTASASSSSSLIAHLPSATNSPRARNSSATRGIYVGRLHAAHCKRAPLLPLHPLEHCSNNTRPHAGTMLI